MAIPCCNDDQWYSDIIKSKGGVFMNSLKSRGDIMKEFNISFGALKRIENELNLFDKDDKSNKKFTKYTKDSVERHINENYKLPKDAAQIGNSNVYVSRNGAVYKENRGSGLFYKAKLYINHGYARCGVNGKNKRVHRLVAKAFIPNPSGHSIVLHVNNDKLDNRVENLKWGTVQENTQQAYDDGLATNFKGYEDSQSLPVNQYNLDGKIIASYGSITRASIATGVYKNTIARQCKNKTLPRGRDFYFRYQRSLL